MNSIEKGLPQNIEAERGLLGSLIIDPDAIGLVADTLRIEDFYRDVHRSIYEAMLLLYERRIPADYITLCDQLEKMGRSIEGDWDIYLDRLTDQVPTSAHVEHYAALVRETAENRQLISVAGRIAALGYEQADDGVEQAEALIYGIGQRHATSDFVSMPDTLGEYMNELDTLQERKGKVVGIPTGLHALDGVVGGLQRSDLVLLAARPSQGKTSLALTIAHNAAIKYKQHVAIASLEMSKKQLAQRLVSMSARVDLQKLRTAWLEEEDWGKITTAVKTLSEGKLWIADTTGLSVALLRSKCRRLKAKHGLDLLIVDYLQLMGGTDPRQHMNRVQEISDISRGLKLLAVELDIPILALSQLSRKVEERPVKIPMLSDLRDSGSLEQDSDIVLFIYRDEYYNAKSERRGIADIIISKHRNGPVGEVALAFEASLTRFSNLADREEVA